MAKLKITSIVSQIEPLISYNSTYQLNVLKLESIQLSEGGQTYYLYATDITGLNERTGEARSQNISKQK